MSWRHPGHAPAAFAIDALDRGAWWAYGLWLVLTLSCKFYVAVPVAALGVVIWLQGQRRAGLLTALLAVVWGVVAFLVIRPFLRPQNRYKPPQLRVGM
ncbi:MAG: DUF2079 domain-containing protein [Anaerolineae bacterium]|nr:DUF2079 domain-containing protein [Anaerolineae bacterium]